MYFFSQTHSLVFRLSPCPKLAALRDQKAAHIASSNLVKIKMFFEEKLYFLDQF
jgi:hypothetical protein